MALSINTKVWLYGLAAAAIGAMGSSFATVLVAPDRFNVTSISGFEHLCILAAVSGVINGGAYLAKSPLPALTFGPGDTIKVQNPTMSPDGSVTADSAVLKKGPAAPTATLPPGPAPPAAGD